MEPSASIRLEPQPKARRASRASLEPLPLEPAKNPKRPSSASLEPSIPFSPSRVSSEAPEVVPGQPLPEPFVYMTYEQARSKRASSEGSEDLKPWEVREKEKGKLVPTPQIAYDQTSLEDISYQEKPAPRRRTFGLLYVTIFVVIAFLVGGGIGGGVGGAVAASEKSKSSTLQSSGTASASATPSTSTVIVDTAGCPLVNNSTFTSTSKTNFLKLCATEIVAPANQYIEISNSVQGSFDSCLNSCAATTGCVGASWVIFSPTNPSRNSVCYLKNKTGVATAASVTGETVVSGFLASAIGL
ncbi:uncharacterized protein K444DRAFT_634597 [Hyaloscypha bicolor E]|uniref:Apple domain-containing protein n=1 Tax=Hyaloscypha bicolor E TaxID=1095630 RepID=A0A2J6SUU4_9HELO|nr:uncharacterized protein K444DRAFT_634597 [Hyaloscypha bicolor E]PMD54443.1 hypothetical protein K444DRAFT_634597 [Hyaloscypha bicolor E]